MFPSGIELMLPSDWSFPNRSNSLGFWTGRGQQDPVKEREDGGVGADAQCQGEDGDNRVWKMFSLQCKCFAGYKLPS